MHNKKIMRQWLVGIMLFGLLFSNAHAAYEPNDNYSSLILAYQSSAFSSPVCIGAECHEGVGGLAVVYTRQLFVPHFALGASGSYLTSTGNTSSIKSSNGSVFMEGIAGLGKRVDVGAILAALSTTLERCSTTPSGCNSTPDRGTDVAIFGKVFLDDIRSVTVGLRYDYITYQKASTQTIITLSLVTIIAQHHKLAFSVDRVRDSNGSAVSGGYGFGYSYLIF